ncbi:MAG: alpha/beta hydrolase [Promethearchaeota archaeon]
MGKKTIIDNPTVSNIVFHPRKTSMPKELDPNFKILKFQIRKNVIIGGFFYLHNPNYPTILLFHRNGELAADYKNLLSFFFWCPINLAVVDYRGYGFSSGEPFYTSLLVDAVPIYNEFHRWMRINNLRDSLFVQGRGLGSTCASEIGSHNPKSLRGIIFDSGFASLYEIFTTLFRISSNKLTPESLDKFSNDTRIRKFKKPTLVIHGTDDWIIPFHQGELIFENLSKEIDKRLVPIEGANNTNIFNFEDEYRYPLKEFINDFGW